MTAPRILIATGGTAGHVVPALAVADALRANGAEVQFVGSDRAEAELVPAAGYEFHQLSVVSLPRRSPLGAARAIAIDTAAMALATSLVARLRPRAVFGGGGYVAGPVGLAAAMLRTPLVIAEIDGHLGLTNRMLAPLARRVCVALPLPGHSSPKFVITGRPIPPIPTDRQAARARFGVEPDETLVLVFGGSLGARSINEAAISGFAPSSFRVLHAAGERDLPSLHAPRPGYDLRGYISGLMDAIVACDLAVARSGGSIWELAAAGRPSVLIPYPHATADHQTVNARYLADAGAAVVIPDAELSGERLRTEVDALLADPARLEDMGRAALGLARPHAAAVIASEVLAAAGVQSIVAGNHAGERAMSAPARATGDASRPWIGRVLHFVGIGGAGMSGLALIAHKLGASVTGSDQSTSPYMEPLRALGIEPVIGHAGANVPAGAEVVYSSAVAPENPERAAAGVLLHRSQLLAQIAKLKRCLAVSGAAGKTTTTAMIVHVLRACGMDPAYAVGAELRSTGLNADWGEGDWIVIEADESDRSLLNYTPEIALLTNSELDHHSTYSSRLDLEATFAEFVGRARTAVVWDRPGLLAIAAGAQELVPYDAERPDLTPAGARFVWRGIEVRLAVPGLHNAINAAGALSASAAAGADPVRAAAALADFQGARRRMERLGESASGAWVYDDYAHHPMKVAAAVAGARSMRPKRLVVVFQPHLYSRTRALAREFGVALAGADVCAVVDVYPARERAEDFPGVDGRLVAAAAADAADGRLVAWLPVLADAQRWLEATLRPGDLCLVMGAGNVNSLGRALVAGS